MFLRTGEHVSRYPYLWIVLWIIGSTVAYWLAPDYHSVWQDGEFRFLPDDMPSQRAEELFREAFPSAEGERFEKPGSEGTSVQQDPLGSNIVIVLERNHWPTGLTDEDRTFIQDVLLPRLREIQARTPLGYDTTPLTDAEPIPPEQQIVKGISTWADHIGPLLTSADRKATLVVIELTTEFLERQNRLVIARVKDLLKSREMDEQKPLGLSMELSGSATVGHDMLKAERDSAANTELFTKLLVIVLLLLIYRAPLLALVPLVTVGVAVGLTKALLRILAGWGWIGMFTGLEVYVTVVVYGAGVDYCLFLIARYKEELDSGLDHRAAMSTSIHRVGAALATSAGTSIVGIGMMCFSDFGKFRQAGFAIAFGLLVVLFFALTFTPAFLLIFGKWAFWPQIRREEVSLKSGWIPSSSLWSKIQEQRWLEQIWEHIAAILQRRPASVFALTIVAMLPFAAIGVINQDNLSYGLLTDLPQGETSVRGAKAVQTHFPAGITGPVTVLVRFDEDALNEEFEGEDLTDFRTSRKLSQAVIEGLVQLGMLPGDDADQETNGITIARVLENSPARRGGVEPGDVLVQVDRDRVTDLDSFEAVFQSLLGSNDVNVLVQRDGKPVKLTLHPLGIADVRNQVHPLGMSEHAQEYLGSLSLIEANAARTFAHRTFNSVRGPVAGQVLRTDIILEADPFSRPAIEKLTVLEANIRAALPESLQQSAEILPLGTTAGIRDLKIVTDHDRIVIDILVIIAVYIVLVLLLRQPEICGYLIASVVFSYVVTLGATFVFFYLRDPSGFTGIDWKVPIYLFTILIAMGEDYNILLMARVEEEQKVHGYVGGVLEALKKTGSIISTCGIIMAGTFCSLMSGTLLGMVQLGFALAFGVMLDTFIVRPVLVPAYLLLLYGGRFGRLGRLLGAPADIESSPNSGPPNWVPANGVEPDDNH